MGIKDFDLGRAPRGTYSDFVIGMRRLDSKTVGVTVDASPAGSLTQEVMIAFPESESTALRQSFLSIIADGGFKGGRAEITAGEASKIGDRLAQVLFPPAIFRLFAPSLAAVAENGGLRLRLAMEPDLLDLPWEYVARPDRRGGGECHVSDLLLLDPSISMVRHAARAGHKLAPITGRQRLAFVGTFWEGQRDGWEVGKEFALLNEALQPVSSYLSSDFMSANSARGFGTMSLGDAAVFHYAGHSDFDAWGRAYLLKELPTSRQPSALDGIYLDDLAPLLGKAGTRLVVLSACNSGFSSTAGPLIAAGVPVVIGVNGGVASFSAIQFCGKLYESLAIGLSLDEAVSRARLYLFELGGPHQFFDWGLFMVHMTCPGAVVFPRRATADLDRRQRGVRAEHAQAIGASLERVRTMDGLNFGEIMSELTRRRVLILGRFSKRRLAVLETIKEYLAQHENGYLPEVFTFDKPMSRDLVEAIIGFAALSRFVIADLSEPRSVQQELEAIAPHFQSVPIVPLLNTRGREFATFESIRRRVNVVKPIVRYRDAEDLRRKLGTDVVPKAESKLEEVRPPTHA